MVQNDSERVKRFEDLITRVLLRRGSVRSERKRRLGISGIEFSLVLGRKV